MPRASLAQKKDFVAKALCPRILVASSSGVEDACRASSFDSLADMLAPFGQDISAQITIQDGQGAPYFLDKINVKFVTDFRIEKQLVSGPEVDELVHRSIAGDAERIDPSFLTATGIDMAAVSAEEPSAWAPWYTLFRQQWVSMAQPSEHESFMHPVACFLAASASEVDPVGTLKDLQTHPAVQRVQNQSFSGSSVLMYYMLVHDERDTAAMQTVDYKFDQVRKTFGQNCSLLRINSNTDLLDIDDSDRSKISSIWSGSLATTLPLTPQPERAYGAMLTMRDVATLKDAVKQAMVRSVVPHMQYIIRVLSDQTASQRRGLTGRLFSAGRRYFGTSARVSSTLTGVDGDTYFKYDSPEAMMRKLADYSFMLKDFRFAQSVYQVARRDFQSEKAWKCYAGAQEMVGLCKLMWEVQATKAEFDSNFEDAIAMYLHKTHVPRQFLAVRCIVLYYELLKHHKMYSYAPGALSRTPSSFTSLFALMNEQAAYSLLKLSPRPEVRKFSFYAMIAAQSYQKAEMGEPAHRCFRMVRLTLGVPREVRRIAGEGDSEADAAQAGSAQEPGSSEAESITARSSWAAIDSYINHELGRQCVAAQSYDEAFQYFLALMGDDKVPPTLQSKYLQELLQLFLESGDRSAIHGDDSRHPSSIELSLPVIDPNMARVIMSPNLEGEDGMYEWRLDGAMPTAADGGADSKFQRCCSVSETVAVLLVVSNPLTIGVTLNNFTLECEFVADAGNSDGQQNAELPYEVTTVQSVVLEGGQTTMVTVQIVPRQPGQLSILGAKYLLCDILPTFKSLKLPGRRLNDTKEQMMQRAYAPDTTLRFRVDPDLPHLQIALEGFPDTLMSGSMHRASVCISNCGELPCRNVALWLSHPSFFDIKAPRMGQEEGGAQDDAGSSSGESDGRVMYEPSSDIKPVEQLQVPNTLQNCSALTLVGQPAGSASSQSLNAGSGSSGQAGSDHFAPASSLDPGESLTVPVWIRGDRVGAHTLSMCIGASSSLADPKLSKGRRAGSESRTMRSRKFDIDLLVTPSLRVNAFVRPSIKSPSERLLGIEVENMQADLQIQLVQTTFSSGYYELVPLSAPKQSSEAVLVGPQQTVSLMFRARPFGQAVQSQAEKMQSRALPELFTVDALRQYIYSNEKPSAAPGPVDLVYSNSVLAEQGVDCVHSSLHSYIMRTQALRRRSALRTNFPLIPEESHPYLFPLFETFGIDFVLFWREVGGSLRSGHHSITGIDLGVPHDYITEALTPPSQGAARTLLAESMQERDALIQSIANRPSAAVARSERPLDVSISVTSIEEKTAMGSPTLYVADAVISVYNNSWRHAYDFVLDLLSPADLDSLVPAGVRLDYSGSRSAWSWFGKTKHSLSVQPHRLVEVRAMLACYAPGVVDIRLWRLEARALPPSCEASPSNIPSFYSSKSSECVLYPLQPHFVFVGAK